MTIVQQYSFETLSQTQRGKKSSEEIWSFYAEMNNHIITLVRWKVHFIGFYLSNNVNIAIIK